jgi:hypothetical protein
MYTECYIGWKIGENNVPRLQPSVFQQNATKAILVVIAAESARNPNHA